jgi:hypothetical protein
MFFLPTLSLALHPVLDPVPGPTLHPSTASYTKMVGDLAVMVLLASGGRNQEHGFFSCLQSPATELLTTWFGLLSKATIGSLHFSS